MESGSIDASYAVALDSRRRNLLVWRLAAVAGFTGVLFGYDISAINDAVSARPALIIGVGAALMNALVGVGAVIYYSTDIFQTAGVCSGRSPRTKTAAAPPSPSARRGRQPTAARASLATRRWTRRSWWLQARSQRAAFWPSDAGAASMTPSICRNGRPFRHMRSMLDSRSARPNMSTCLPPRAPANRVRASDPAVSGKKCG
jgi:hypothetical protein